MHHTRMFGTVAVVAIAFGALAGCAKPVPAASDEDAIEVASTDEESLPPEEWCAAYASTLDMWNSPFQPIDEERFDAAIGVNFTGPADCYLARYPNGDTAVRPASIVAVFVCDDASIAQYMNQAMPLAGWAGTIADPRKGGRFAHPTLGDIGYVFNESAKASNIPLDDPAVVVTALLMP